MASKANIKAAEKLAERYETITLEEIEKAFEKYEYKYNLAKNKLTGFGLKDTCLLCKSARDGLGYCNHCIYYNDSDSGIIFFPHCRNDGNKETYVNISNAETPEELLTAYRERGKHTRSILKEIQTGEE
jgi:hypothetical protein